MRLPQAINQLEASPILHPQLTRKWDFATHGPAAPTHPPVHHPLDACYYSVVDELQLSLYLVSPW
jgi:hypothetical protein